MARSEVAAQIGGVTLQAWEGDITQADTAAIANAANNHLWMGSGVAGAIKRAGGREIEVEAVAQGPIPVGSAIATSAGRLPFQAIIHGAVMGQDLTTSPELITRTTHACLELADERGLESLALPAFGTGVGGFPREECARLMVRAAAEFARRGPRALRRIVFVLWGEDAFRAFARELEGLMVEASS